MADFQFGVDEYESDGADSDYTDIAVEDISDIQVESDGAEGEDASDEHKHKQAELELKEAFRSMRREYARLLREEVRVLKMKKKATTDLLMHNKMHHVARGRGPM